MIKYILISLILPYKLLSQPVIGNISVSGNSFFSYREITNMMNSNEGKIYNHDQLKLDLQNIIGSYQKAGFINCYVNYLNISFSDDSSEVYISIDINEGNRIKIGEIVINGNKLLSKQDILNELEDIKPGEILDEVKLKYGISKIINIYESKGYPFVTLSVTSIEIYGAPGNEKIRLNLNIEENEKMIIDNIVIEGNSTTRRETILREMRIKEGETVTRETLIQIRQNLENTGFFENVSLPEIRKYNNETVMFITIKEGNTNTIDGILGYVPPKENQLKGYFTGLIKLSLKNIFGTGRRLDAGFEKLESRTQYLELSYQEPWILGYPLKVSVGFNQRIQDSSYVHRGFNFKTEAAISSRFTITGIAIAERVIPDFSAGILNQFDSRTVSAGIELKYDSRNYIYNPSSGFLYKTGYVLGQKKIYNASSFQGLNPYLSVQKISATFDFYSSFFKRQTLLSGVKAIEIRLPQYEISDLFRLGGLSTIRGYREGQFLVSRAVWMNIEPRFSITRKSFLFAFYDGGYYFIPDNLSTGKSVKKDFIFGYGIGIRVETSLGIIGVSYGLGKGDSILDGKLHFGILNDF
ncbi:MAG: BamA/TamA family outer membrane protein [Ignavibacteria bacterium]|nr:BamA/TamA family outer membrane protein [Ignavibacteria bacterium]